MGGFRLVNRASVDKKNRAVLTLDYLKEHPEIDMPEVTTADIDDRSKGDPLWKIIAIMVYLTNHRAWPTRTGSHRVGTRYACACQFEWDNICDLVAQAARSAGTCQDLFEDERSEG